MQTEGTILPLIHLEPFLWSFQVTLAYRDYHAVVWEEFNIKDVCTSSLRIDVLTHYTVQSNGFREVQPVARIY